jgi:hypothetical protein
VRVPRFTWLRPPAWWTICLATAIVLPLLTSSLGGLEHRVSCRTAYTPDFEITADGSTEPLISSAIVLTRDAPSAAVRCPGFSIDARVNPSAPLVLSTVIAASNTSTKSVHATVQVRVAGKRSQIPLGVIDSGQTVEKTLTVHVPRGTSVLRARLLLGG